MARSATPFLMFTGESEEAMALYLSVFPDSRIERVQRFGAGEQGPEGSVKRADFTIAGQRFICFDSPPVHAFGFTPSFSIFVDCEDEAEIDSAFERLSAGGEVMMPLGEYGFSRKFGWLADRFGVSWQLNLV